MGGNYLMGYKLIWTLQTQLSSEEMNSLSENEITLKKFESMWAEPNFKDIGANKSE